MWSKVLGIQTKLYRTRSPRSLLRASGAREVVSSEVRPFRRALVERMNFLARNPAATNLQEALQQLIGQRFVDPVFDACGQVSANRDAIQCCKVGAEIIFVGIPKSLPGVDILSLVFKKIRTSSAGMHTLQDYLAAIAPLVRRRRSAVARISQANAATVRAPS